MGKSKIEKLQEAHGILKKYSGNNPYFIYLKNGVLVYQNVSLNDFQIEFILNNFDKEPKLINKVVKIADWYGVKKQEEFNFEFIPKVVEIGYFLGETSNMYVFYGRFRKSQEKGELTFAPKKAILTNFLIEDFRNMSIDFEKYNGISADKRILKKHQEEGIKFLLSRKKCILADEPGAGKTSTATVASIEGGFKHILIICPASVKQTWKDELSVYVPQEDIAIVESIITKRKNELEAFLGYQSGESGKSKDELLKEARNNGKWVSKKYTIVNYDILDEFYTVPTENKKITATEIDENGKIVTIQKEVEVISRKSEVINSAMSNSELYLSKFDLVIIDEAHKLSNMSSDRYKIIVDLMKRSNPDGIYCITGTPITNNPYNFYNILRIINAPIVDDWTSFVERYCDGKKIYVKAQRDRWTNMYLKTKNKSSWYELSDYEKSELNVYLERNCKSIWLHNGATNLEELKERVKSYYLRREKSDFGNIVKKDVKVIEYDLDSNERESYNIVLEEFKNKMAEKGSTTSEMTEGLVMRQWLAEKMIPHTVELANRHIQNGEKVIIFCCFDNELYSLQKYFMDKCVIYNGKLLPRQKEEAKRAFMDDKDKMVLIGNVNAAGVGITLTSGNICIFNNFSWVPGDNLQAEDRIHRLSQTKDCIIYYQTFKDTFYTKMLEKVNGKQNVINSIIVKENLK